jgi:hypothetical protein
VISKIGVQRGRALVAYAVVSAHANASLDTLEDLGVLMVMVTPERIRRAPPPVRDAEGEEEIVEVLTAGDDDVCEECEDISVGGPYEIDEARGLIPAHPRCRCAFVPAEDARFAAVEKEID